MTEWTDTGLWAVLEGDELRRYERGPVAVEEGWSCIPVQDRRPAPTADQAEPASPTRCAVVDGGYRRWWEPQELAGEALERLRAAAVAANNDAAGRARLAYITAIPGQSETYAKKQAEALRWSAAGQPADVAAADYPWAARRAARMITTVAAVLAEWSAIIVAIEDPGLDIEDERERVNELIASAGTPSAIRVAKESARYSVPA